MGSTFLVIFLLYSVDSFVLSPPRGWNSWQSYRSCINETQVIENAEAVVKYLQPYGYELIVIDGGWASGVDEYGRPIPDTNKYPHSKDGTFKWLSEQIHSMGL
eukprot:144974_1